ncbi:MAG: PTS sugar transporter subunit IIA [Alphaproteobacteria bacterium]|nr:PTS sugar transporter subunit IIA [Alphaproteobacteria bacterium]
MNPLPALFSFDVILPEVKTPNVKKLFDVISESLVDMTGLACPDIMLRLKARLTEDAIHLTPGCALLDIRSPHILKPVVLLARIPRGVNVGQTAPCDVDLVCVIVLPEQTGAFALQSLSRWARLLQHADFLNDIRRAADADDIHILMSNPRTRLLAA